MDDEIAEIYGQLAEQISRDEFEKKIDEKVSLMGGLCDKRTAAMLVARELGAGEVAVKIGRIKPESGTVTFIGRVVSISDIREFTRSDGSSGKVANVTFGDETGTTRVVLWDEATELIRDGDIKVDQCLKVRGFAREGYSGTEVGLGRGGGFEEVDEDIRARVEPFKISEIKRDMGDINLVARVLDAGAIREFVRKDGAKGLVRSVLLGDRTGKIYLTLWNEKTGIDIAVGDALEIINGYSREQYGQVEIQAGGNTVVRKSNSVVDYMEEIIPISELEPGMLCSVAGYVTGMEEIREFERQNGTSSRVANIYVSDETGRIRVALWGDHARLIGQLDLGSKIELVNCQVKSGWKDELEISCGWKCHITFAPPEQIS